MGAESGEDFESFVARRRGNWIRIAMRIVRNPADAEDVVQDTLLSVWRQWQKRSLQNPEGYVHRAITLNALKRRSARRENVAIDSVPEPAAIERDYFDPVELEQAIEKLSPPQQVVVRTRFYLGMTFAQIGKSLSISTNTVASRCRYALASLRKSMNLERETNTERKLP